MVQVRAHQPINTDGSINLEAWLDHTVSVDMALDREALKEACEFAREAELKHIAAKGLSAEDVSSFSTGLEIAEILADLKLDQDSWSPQCCTAASARARSSCRRSASVLARWWPS